MMFSRTGLSLSTQDSNRRIVHMQAWESFLAQQEKEIGSEVVEKWLRPLKILRFDAGNLYLEAKDYFQALWFEEHIRPKVQTSLVTSSHRKVKIHLSIANDSSSLKEKGKEKRQRSKKETDSEKNKPSILFTFDTLDPYCTFNSFVVSKENQLAFKVMKESATQNGKQNAFNPIYLYGPNGSGKTHLLLATAHALKQQGLEVIYIRAETFTEHVVNAIRAGEMSSFRSSYRNIDVLLIDDVHIFSRKGATQEEFFHTFNTLYLAGKQLILSANCAPQKLELIEPRLISRFEWGISIGLETSKQEELKQILHAKCQALQFPLPAKIADFLIDSFPRGPKVLFKALEALILRSHLEESTQKLTIPLVKEYLADIFLEEEKNAITPKKIIHVVGEFYGIRPDDILGTSQNRETVLPRQIAMFLCRNKLKMPFMKIGDFFSRDHSTVISSVKRVEKECEAGNHDFRNALETISSKL